MEQDHSPHQPEGLQRHMRPTSETETKSHKLLDIDTHARHQKSLSLPFMTSPIHGPEESSSDDEEEEDDGDDYNSEDEEHMFVKSLPSDFFLMELSGYKPEIETQDKNALEVHPVHVVQITEDEDVKHSTCMESTEDQIQMGIQDTKVSEGWEENRLSTTEDKDQIPKERNKRQR